MCEATVYLIKDEEKREIMRDVELLEGNDGKIRIANILGREETVEGRIRKIDLIKNEIFIES